MADADNSSTNRLLEGYTDSEFLISRHLYAAVLPQIQRSQFIDNYLRLYRYSTTKSGTRPVSEVDIVTEDVRIIIYIVVLW